MKLHRKHLYILTALTIIMIVTIFLSSFQYQNSSPVCHNGFVDLSRWNFEEDGNVILNGSWEFYPNTLLTPQDFTSHTLPEVHYIKVPSPWSAKRNHELINERGTGTYRLKIRIKKTASLYGIKSVNIRTSCNIYVNGLLIGNSGNPAYHIKDGYKSNNTPIVSYFSADSETLELVIQVANLEYSKGGIIQNIYFGTAHSISQYNFKCQFFDSLFTFALLFFALYSIGIFAVQKEKHKAFLYSALLCFLLSFLIASSGEKIFNILFNNPPYLPLIKVKIAAVCLSVCLITQLIRELYKITLPHLLEKCISILMLFFTFLTVLLPSTTTAFMEAITYLFFLIILTVLCFFILRSISPKRTPEKKDRLFSFLAFVMVLSLLLLMVAWGLYYNSLIAFNTLFPVTLIMFLGGLYYVLIKHYEYAYNSLEEMSRNLIAMDKLKDEFLLNTSHELKTPLHAIINISKITLENEHHSLSTKHAEALSYIYSTANRLSSLINDIMDIQKLKNNTLYIDFITFDVNAAVQTSMEVLKYLRKNEEIKMINKIPPKSLYLTTDEKRFQQILYNLIDNSLKYTDTGYLELSAHMDDTYLYLYVTDTGRGIDYTTQKMLFKENLSPADFYFLGIPSAGLGLYISKLLAVRLGGDLYLEWSKPGTGSIFALKLPINNKSLNSPLLTDETAPAEASENNTLDIPYQNTGNNNDNFGYRNKILLVNDTPSNIKVLQEIFSDPEYELLVAYDGKSALELIKIHKDLSLVILDVMIPGLSCYAVCKEIRRYYKPFELPILLLTFRNTPEDIKAGLEAGANDFVLQPFHSTELKAKAGTFLELKRAVSEALQMEYVFLQSQIKPHFLYNTLNSITALCYSDGERAAMLLGKLGDYLRCAFMIDPRNSFVTIENELAMVKSYVILNQVRFGDRLQVNYDIEEDLLSYTIPTFIIQPLIENSIGHGIMKRLKGGTIDLAIRKDSGRILISVKDDGVGIPSEELCQLLSDDFTGSIGLKNINKRLIIEYGQGLLIESVLGSGTTATIYIPLLQM